MLSKSVKIINHGMINIPATMRKKFGWKDGDNVMLVVDEEGFIRVYPIESIEQIRARSFTSQEMIDQLKRTRQEDLEREL